MSEVLTTVAVSGFPQEENIATMLHWMGSDYAAALVNKLQEGLLKQDAGSRLVSVHCSNAPSFETAFKQKAGGEGTGIATRMSVSFPIEAVVVDSKLNSWRLFITTEYQATGLDMPASSQVKVDFSITRTEPA